MKTLRFKIIDFINKILDEFSKKGILNKTFNLSNFTYNLSEPNVPVKNNKNGFLYNYASNVAMVAKSFSSLKPMELAKVICAELVKEDLIVRADVAQPGFINMTLSKKALSSIVFEVLEKNEKYGSNVLENEKINVEFVSANPTGFLHVGHARGAAIGDSLVRILRHAGKSVIAEYYVNDAGNQINLLVDSTYFRYKELFGITSQISEEFYKGQDIVWLATEIKNNYKDTFLPELKENKEKFRNLCVSLLLERIKLDLIDFGVNFDLFSSEKNIISNQKITETLKQLSAYTYKKDDALFLKTTDFGDDKDRVLVKSDNSLTYMTPDIAYHREKFLKSNRLINVWGADHSGYILRIKIAMQCLGFEQKDIEILIVQMVRLIKNGEEFKMSKRAGTSVTLRDLLSVSSKDSIRFMMLTRDANSKYDFDIDDSNQSDSKNPVFTVQYAHSRAYSILKKSTKKPIVKDIYSELKEVKLIMLFDAFPELIKTIALTNKVQLMTSYLINLSNAFNSFYNDTKIIENKNEEGLLALVKSTKILIKLGASLIGVNTPDSM